nr:putative ribonuclease H-like domain-containing protein [Tanacetum cinerariifolium]
YPIKNPSSYFPSNLPRRLYVAFLSDKQHMYGHFQKYLKANLLQVSQKCVTRKTVFSPDYKLLDKSQVLLKVPRNNNMYSFELKNIVPVGGIENQMDHKVKTIICDNGFEFKNNIMNEFCEMKGIRREFRVARTPQQNGNQTNGNASFKANVNAGQAGKKTIPGRQYVLPPLLTTDSQGLKSLKDEVARKKSTEVS